MTLITHIDLDADPIEHAMPLRAAEGIVQPPSVSAILAGDDRLAAVSVEYVCRHGGDRISPTLPLIFWQKDHHDAKQVALCDLRSSALKEVGSLLSAERETIPAPLVPGALEMRASHLCDGQDNEYLLAIYLRDVSFYLRSDIGLNLQEIEGTPIRSRTELARIMSRAVGEAWCHPSASNHERVAQRARLDAQARVFDSIFLDQTGVAISTTLDPALVT